GGIPVVRENHGKFRGVEAVIDKDRASSVLAREIGASLLMILTEVDYVYLNFGKPNEKPLERVTLEQIERFYSEGHFPPGSMGPKIEAAIDFLKNGGEEVIITSIEKAHDALYNSMGTHIVV
ncbi:MAG: carbamate kinase, partial [Candidatus Hydrothermae bacterium]|nr:carbamate kinase [Candidatus Hydrothermae bacterium]